MTNETKEISEAILLKLYDCSAKHSGSTWSFESAFRACGRTDPLAVRQKILSAFVAKGWIESDNGFAPYDIALGVNGPDLSGETAVRLTPRGVDAALSILESRAPKSIGERIKCVPQSDWIALVALIISLVALLK